MKINYLYAFVLFFLISSCTEEGSERTSFDINVDGKVIQTHLSELSKDYYEGRMPFSTGEERTVAYIESEFKKMGLEPANEGSYIQSVPLVEINSTPDEKMLIRKGNKNLEFDLNTDFMIHTERQANRVDLKDSELVFCGFGINSKEFDWNDYEGMDLKGKTAVVLVNDPGFGGEDESFFKGNTMTYFGRWTYKYEEADRMGLAGLIIIHETASAGYPWYVVQSSWSGEQLGLKRDPNKLDCGIKGWIHLDAAKELFEFAGLDLGEQIRASRKKGFKPVAMNASITAGVNAVYREDVSKNVVGMIKGANQPEEYVIYTAHWDHIGISQAENGDSIYNGALDNASGTATVMAIAKAMVEAPQLPDRSVVFLMVTAEEQGLLGSEYYVENPIFPIASTVCNLNMDGVNPHGRMKDVTIVGYGQSEMDDYAEAVAKTQDRYILADQEPEKGYFFRSDHFNFAKVGIPPLYAEGAYDHRAKGKSYALKQKEIYNKNNYHRPSDEYIESEWDIDGMLEDAQLYYDVGLNIANSKDWPEWKEGSEFSRKVKN